VFYSLAPEDGYSYSQAVIEFPYGMYVLIVRGFQSSWINSLDANAAILGNILLVFFFSVICVPLMSYACHDVTELDGREASIFIIISSVGISLSINDVVKTRRYTFMIHASVRPMLSLRSSDKYSSMYDVVISSYCGTLKCTSLTEL
jgi:hypothetical protein